MNHYHKLRKLFVLSHTLRFKSRIKFLYKKNVEPQRMIEISTLKRLESRVSDKRKQSTQTKRKSRIEKSH